MLSLPVQPVLACCRVFHKCTSPCGRKRSKQKRKITKQQIHSHFFSVHAPFFFFFLLSSAVVAPLAPPVALSLSAVPLSYKMMSNVAVFLFSVPFVIQAACRLRVTSGSCKERKSKKKFHRQILGDSDSVWPTSSRYPFKSDKFTGLDTFCSGALYLLSFPAVS